MNTGVSDIFISFLVSRLPQASHRQCLRETIILLRLHKCNLNPYSEITALVHIGRLLFLVYFDVIITLQSNDVKLFKA